MNNSRHNRGFCLTLVVGLLALPACKKDEEGAREAVSELRNADGGTVGTATLTETDGGVQVEFEGSNLPPGTHGFHIHETGECEAPSFESAGGHFNPTGVGHGLEDPDGAHVGDMPNLEVEVNGTANYTYTVKNANLEESGDRSLLAGNGTALVIHADADDGVTDPAGDAGPRIACGVIEQKS